MEGNATSKKLVGTMSGGYSMTGSVGTVFTRQVTAEIPTKVSAFENDAGYITSEALEGYALASAVLPISDDYVTKDDLKNYALKTDIPNVSGFQTEAQVLALIQANMPVSGDEVSY